MILNILFAIVIVISLISMVVLHNNLQRRHNSEIERKEMIIEQIQDIELQRLVGHVRRVMQGEIIYEEGALVAYSNNNTRARLGSDLYRIESNLNIIDLRLEEDSGQAIVTYDILYLDSEGKILAGMSSDLIMPDKWILEKIEGEWVIIEIVTVWEFKEGELEIGESILWREQ